MSTKIRKALKISDFSRYPGGRYRQDGKNSGEEYRELILEPLIESGADLEVDTNGVFVIAPSFLDEAFGPFVVSLGEKEFRQRFSFLIVDDPDLEEEIDIVIASRKKK